MVVMSPPLCMFVLLHANMSRRFLTTRTTGVTNDSVSAILFTQTQQMYLGVVVQWS